MPRRANPSPLTAEGCAEVRAELRRRLQAQRGGSKRLAYESGVSRQFIWRVAAGRAAPTEKIAVMLGFRRVVRFERSE